MTRSQPHTERQDADIDIGGLIASFRMGDARAFDSLYALYQSRIYRFCRRMMADDVLAKDAFQETFIKMYEHRAELRGENITSWLFAIARRVCLNMLRSRRVDHDAFDESFHAHAQAADGDVVLRERIEAALQRLPLTLREALVLREYEGHSYNEIAAIVGIDLSLAKVRVYRARLLMRKYLAAVMLQER
jgi:RNA polymerase sigma-70 factor, ECF subfamily